MQPHLIDYVMKGVLYACISSSKLKIGWWIFMNSILYDCATRSFLIFNTYLIHMVSHQGLLQNWGSHLLPSVHITEHCMEVVICGS